MSHCVLYRSMNSAMIARAAEAIVTRGFRRALRERRARQRQVETGSDDAVRAFLDVWDRETGR